MIQNLPRTRRNSHLFFESIKKMINKKNKTNMNNLLVHNQIKTINTSNCNNSNIPSLKRINRSVLLGIYRLTKSKKQKEIKTLWIVKASNRNYRLRRIQRFIKKVSRN